MKLWTKLAAAAALTVVVTGPVYAQQAAPQPASIGGHPNLNGIWQALNTAFWDLEPHSAQTSPVAERAVGAIGAIPAGLGVVEGGEIPYLPEAKAQRDANRRNAVAQDPEAGCYLPGIPRATYMNYAFQIIQGNDDDILVAYEYASANRVIYMRDTEIPPIDTWMGTSYGAWEGNTLVVTTLAQNGQSWLDRAGNYLTSTSTVVERFTPKGPNHIDYQATISDPALYSKPWTIKMPLYRKVEDNAQLLEFKCVPFAEVHLYGDLLELGDTPAPAAAAPAAESAN
jgi:hypothetical protein